jgi:hypothetical protein
MTKKQLLKNLQIIHKDLTKVELRMEKISDGLGMDRGHEFLERTLYEVEELIKMFDQCPECGLSGKHKMSCDTQYKENNEPS